MRLDLIMMPVDLCMFYSIMAGEDKLVFSMFVELTTDTQVVSHSIARVIHLSNHVLQLYHMLLVDFCLLCSLTAGEDKLAFFVFIELTPGAKSGLASFCSNYHTLNHIIFCRFIICCQWTFVCSAHFRPVKTN